MAVNTAYAPDIKILALGDKFYDRVKAANFPKTILRYRNDAAGKDADKDMAFINSTFLYLENSQAGLAQFYHDFRGGAGRLKQALKGPNKEAYEGREFENCLRFSKPMNQLQNRLTPK